jgi:uncharacterized membrane protein (DUF485 family)
MRSIGWVSTALLLLALGFVVLFAYQVVMGAVGPAEVVLVTIAAAVLATAFVIHQVRVHRALHDHGHRDHAELMRGLHVHRERRGF